MVRPSETKAFFHSANHNADHGSDQDDVVDLRLELSGNVTL